MYKKIINLILGVLLLSTCIETFAATTQSDGGYAFPSTRISGTVDSDTTWTKANSPYILSSSMTVLSGATLTIEAGTVIKLGNGMTMDFRGNLVSNGTISEKVTFTSIDDNSVGGITGDGSPGKGDWVYLRFNGSGNNNSVINYTDIKWGGYYTNYGMVYITSANPTFNNSLINSSRYYGVRQDSGSPTFNDCVFSSNSHYGYVKYGGSATVSNNEYNSNGNMISSNNLDLVVKGGVKSALGNTKPIAYVSSFTLSSGDGTIETADDYSIVVTGGSTFPSGKTLNIEPGTNIKLNNGVTITFEGIVNSNGTSDKNVTFTSVDDHTVGGNTGDGSPGKGDWVYVRFNGAGANASNLKYTNFRWGGYYTNYGMVYITSANPTFSDSLFHGSRYYGVRQDSGAPTINNSLFTSNSHYGYVKNGGSVNVLNNEFNYNGNIISSNNLDFVVKDGIKSATGNTKQAIHTANFTLSNGDGIIETDDNYSIVMTAGSTLASGNTITIEPGTNVKMNNGVTIEFRGVLKSNGTSDSNVNFTSVDDHTVGGITGDGSPGKGDWVYIRFNGSGSDLSDIKYTNFKWGGFYTNYGMVYITGASPTFSNSLFNSSRYYGVRQDSGGPTFNDCVFSSNSHYGYVKYGGSTIVSNNEFNYNGNMISSNNLDLVVKGGVKSSTGNTKPISHVSSFTLSSGDGTIETADNYSIVMTAGSTFPSGKTINIEPGSNIKLNNGVTITFEGVVNSNGTSDKNVTFTSVDDHTVGGNTGDGSPGKGDWVYVRFNGSGANASNLKYTNFRWGGYYTNYGMVYITSANPTFSDSLFHGSRYYGVRQDSGAPTINNSLFTSSSHYGYVKFGGSVNVIDNEFNYNGNIISSNNLDFVVKDGIKSATGNTKQAIHVGSFTLSDGSGIIETDDNYSIVMTAGSTLASGNTITLEPGTNVKLNNGVTIEFRGVLYSNGTSTKNVNFTSVDDHTVGGNTGDGSPSKGDWTYIRFNGSGANDSNIKYTKFKYGGYYTNYGMIYNTSASPTITNSLFHGSRYYGLRVDSGSPIIKNNIFNKNGHYGYVRFGGSPDIEYNLYHSNPSGASNVAIDSNSLVVDPEFIDENNFDINQTSPAVNKGDTSFGNHPKSGDRYDIGVREYNGYIDLIYSSNISGTEGRNLTYEWSFTDDPTNGADVPVLNNATGNISSDKTIETDFVAKKLGTYKIQLEIKEDGTTIGSEINTFTITN